MARGQIETIDLYDRWSLKEESKRVFFASKTPQVIEIKNDQLQIIRCSLENMVRHLSRPLYQSQVRYLSAKLKPLAEMALDPMMDLHDIFNRMKFIRQKMLL